MPSISSSTRQQTLATRQSRNLASTLGAECGTSTLRRVIVIHERLANARRINATTLARELEVSPRTIKRDVEFMRTDLGAGIVWEPSTQTYFYEHPSEHLPLLRLGADEVMALTLAGHTFSAWRGSALGRALTAALRKIAGVVGGAVSLPISEVRTLVFQPDDEPETEAETRWFASCLEAVRRHRALNILYRKPGAKSDEARTIHPLHLAHLDHRWVLIAYDPAKKAPRNFLLARIRQLTTTAAFEPPANFDLTAYLSGSLGRFTGGPPQEVRLHFDATVAPYVRESPWHPTQVATELPAGEIEVSLRLNHLIDVQRRVLACGRHVEVLAPAELRAAVASEARAMVAHYAPRLPSEK